MPNSISYARVDSIELKRKQSYICRIQQISFTHFSYWSQVKCFVEIIILQRCWWCCSIFWWQTSIRHRVSLCYDLTFISLSVEYRDRFQSIELCLLPRQKENTTFILVTTACKYQFMNPVYPSFDLPDPQYNGGGGSQSSGGGDTLLNPYNPIVSSDGSPIYKDCNKISGSLYYKNWDGTFSNTYYDTKGKLGKLPDIIYAKNINQLWIQPIQSIFANLGNWRAICFIDAEIKTGFLTF